MDSTTLLGSYRLLDHPFYRRWEEGTLLEGELAQYAAQYRFFEAQLPTYLSALLEITETPAQSRLVDANLADEIAGDSTHLELFDRFAAAVHAPRAIEMSPAMAALVQTYERALETGDTAYCLGVLAGYEVQAAEVAATKGESLATHYGVTEEGLEFWNLHAELETDHAAWTLEAAEGLDTERVVDGSQASASAWWAYLDEREALVAC